MAEPIGSPVLTPADFATLQNTLGPMGVLTQMEAERVAQAEAMAQRTRAAQEAAGAAGQAYQGAAAAPPPNVAPNEDLINTLTGGLASVLMGSQAPAQRAQQRTRDTRQALLSARADNLRALHDNWSQKAAFAQRVGDLEEETKARTKMDILSKTLVQLNADRGREDELSEREATRRHQLELERMRGDAAARTAGVRKSGAEDFDPDEVEAAVNDLAEGRVQIGDVSQAYGFRRKVQSELRRQGRRIMPQKVRDALNEVGSAETAIADIEALSKQVNTARAGLSRTIKGFKNLGEAVAQTGVANQLNVARGGLAGNLARAVAAERGVLTDQDRKWAMALVPDIWDSEESATAKITRLKNFIAAKKARAIKVYTTVGGGETPQVGDPTKAEPDDAYLDAPAAEPLPSGAANDPLGIRGK